ncbi:MAG TPA: DUF3310 domain-containing protein [Bryobacteraceae bacterium]|nr:DUF3310 domain-containing protein [Bryobacteraceae bacterium]
MQPETKVKPEAIDHPSHYRAESGIEVIDVIEDMGLGWGFCIGNAIKYIARAGEKVPQGKTKTEATIEDLKKALWYLNRANNDRGARVLECPIIELNEIAEAWTLTEKRYVAIQQIVYMAIGNGVRQSLNAAITAIEDEVTELEKQ